jgi:DNA anti-recombination protein RmuC
MSDIDPREFGRLEAQVQALQTEVHLMSSDVKSLLALANKSKGGFWGGMMVASAIGGAITFFVDRVFR